MKEQYVSDMVLGWSMDKMDSRRIGRDDSSSLTQTSAEESGSADRLFAGEENG